MQTSLASPRKNQMFQHSVKILKLTRSKMTDQVTDDQSLEAEAAEA